MSALTDQFEEDLLRLILLNEAITGIGDAAGLQPSATLGTLWISLHTSDPGEGGDQETNEAAYTNYVRVGVVRGATGWTVNAGVGQANNEIAFPAAGSQEQITHVGVGTDQTGPGKLLLKGVLPAPIDVDVSITPKLGSLTVTPN